jgi:hypothetical protein
MRNARSRPARIVAVLGIAFAAAFAATRLPVAPFSYFVIQGQPFSDPAGTRFGILSWQAGLGLTHGMPYPFQSYRPGQALAMNALDLVGGSPGLLIPLQQALVLLVGLWILLRAAGRPRLLVLASVALVGIIVDPQGPLYDTIWLTESPGRSIALLAAFAFAAGVADSRPSLQWLAGIAWAVENLVRPLTLLGPFGLVTAAGTLRAAGRDRHRLFPASLRVLGGFLFVVVPWLARNWAVTGQPMFSYWSLTGAVPLACGGVPWDNRWDARFWWGRMHLTEGGLVTDLSRECADCVRHNTGPYLHAAIRGVRDSIATLARPRRPLLALALLGTLLAIAAARDHRQGRTGAMIPAVLFLLLAAALAFHHPWLAGAMLAGLGSFAALRGDRDTAPLALLVTVNLAIACLMNGLTNGLGRIMEVQAWAVWPLCTAAILPVLRSVPVRGGWSAAVPHAIARWIGRGFLAIPVLALFAGGVTLATSPRRVPAVETATCDNDMIHGRIVAGRNSLPRRETPVTLAGYVAPPVCAFRAGEGDDRARAYTTLRSRDRVVFELIAPVTHFGRKLGVDFAILLPGTIQTGMWQPGLPVVVRGILRFDPAEPYVGRYVLVADRIDMLDGSRLRTEFK